MVQNAVQTRYAQLAQGQQCLSCSGQLDALVALRPGEALLEIGCGRGEVLGHLSGRLPMGATLTGLDTSREMLRQAQINHAGAAITWQLGDMEQLPFPDEQFDWILSDCALNHAQQAGQAVNEIYRVLKPGGRIAIGEPMPQQPLPEAIRQDVAARASCFGGCLTWSEWREIFLQAGFLDLQVMEVRAYQKAGRAFTAGQISAHKGGKT